MDALALGSKLALNALSDKLGGAAQGQESPQAGQMFEQFGELFKKSMDQINQAQSAADKASETYATGGPVELHQVMILTEKAELSMDLAVQVRNKLVSAYQEVMRMGV